MSVWEIIFKFFSYIPISFETFFFLLTWRGTEPKLMSRHWKTLDRWLVSARHLLADGAWRPLGTGEAPGASPLLQGFPLLQQGSPVVPLGLSSCDRVPQLHSQGSASTHQRVAWTWQQALQALLLSSSVWKKEIINVYKRINCQIKILFYLQKALHNIW